MGLYFLLCLLGCQPNQDNQAQDADITNPKPTATAESLRLLVVDDAALAAVAQREWQARSQTRLEISQISEDDLLGKLATPDGIELKTDAILYPSRLLGELAERKLIATLPNLYYDGELLSISDVFPLIRRAEIMWGESTYAVPLGSPQFVLAYHEDVVAEMPEFQPPATWDAFSRWLEQLSNDAAYPSVVAQPLAGRSASALLLARAAGYIRQSGQVSTLFNFRTMEPMIDRPPFVRALRELVADAQYGLAAKSIGRWRMPGNSSSAANAP